LAEAIACRIGQHPGISPLERVNANAWVSRLRGLNRDIYRFSKVDQRDYLFHVLLGLVQHEKNMGEQQKVGICWKMHRNESCLM